jgi:hypothetical protein
MKNGFISFVIPGHGNPMSALARQLQSRNMMSLSRLGGNEGRRFAFGVVTPNTAIGLQRQRHEPLG